MNNQEQAARAQLSRASLAQQVLSNSIYMESFNLIKAKFMDDFTKTSFKQSAERDELWRKMQTIEAVESYIIDVMETGKIAEDTLTYLERGKKLVGL